MGKENTEIGIIAHIGALSWSELIRSIDFSKLKLDIISDYETNERPQPFAPEPIPFVLQTIPHTSYPTTRRQRRENERKQKKWEAKHTAECNKKSKLNMLQMFK